MADRAGSADPGVSGRVRADPGFLPTRVIRMQHIVEFEPRPTKHLTWATHAARLAAKYQFELFHHDKSDSR
ncbi:hypothetical protein [Rhodococcus opacus]|uniref:hypothetical protein n=1 Tax=Rhodococcus opacus TaxID=37919 RepID=UPI0026CCB490